MWRQQLRQALTMGLALVLLTACSAAGPSGGAAVQVSDAWVRAAPQGDVSAGYLTLHNQGKAALSLIGAEADAAGATSLHETVVTSGNGHDHSDHSHHGDSDMAAMRPVGAITLRPGGTVHLQPGGYHIMLMDLQQDLVAGQTIALVLRFGDGTTLSVQAEVR